MTYYERNAKKCRAYQTAYYRANRDEINRKRRDKHKIEYGREYRRLKKMTELMKIMMQLAEDMKKIGEAKHIKTMREQFFQAKSPEEAQNLLKEWGAPVRKFRHIKTNKPCQEW